MYRVLFFLAIALHLASAPPSPPAGRLALGKKEMLAACSGCHPLDTIELRRFDREDWDSVLRKMTVLGARIRNREALLEYLVTAYGVKPAPAAKR